MKYFGYETADKMDFYEYPKDKVFFREQKYLEVSEIVMNRIRWFSGILRPRVGDLIIFKHGDYRKPARRVVITVEALDADNVKLTMRKASSKEYA